MSANTQQQKYGKGGPNSYKKGHINEGQPKDNQSKPQTNNGNGKMKKDTRKWCEF
jgi:hypothetical protein